MKKIIVGQKERAGDGKNWMSREYLTVCMDYLFRQLACKVVIGLVDADKEDVLAFDRHFGFKDVCVIKDGAGDCDLVVLEMRAEDCRWLTPNLKRQLLKRQLSAPRANS